MSKKKIRNFGVNDKRTKYKFRKAGAFIKKAVVGEGAFGKVILVEKDNQIDKNNSKRFAIKMSKRFKICSEKETPSKITEDEKPIESNFMEMREIGKMIGFHHPNVLGLIDFAFPRKEKESWILMDYLNTDLRKFFHLNKENPKIMNENFLRNIARQILAGVNYLHKEGIMHRDLKLENILYDEQKNIVKIADFGLSRKYDYDISIKYTDVGAFPYKPPELLLGLHHYSTELDIWAVGCILVEICIGFPLFAENNSLGVVGLMYKIFGSFNEELLPGYESFPFSTYLKTLPETKGIGLINFIKMHQKFGFQNDDFYDYIEKLLTIDPTKRFNAKECLNHRWLSRI